MKYLKKFRVIIIISVLFLLIIIGYVRYQNSNYLDNILIFNLYDNQEKPDKKFVFDINSVGQQTANINLFSTFKANGLANEKIAPGTYGEFEILLSASKKMKYQIRFDSKNTKPKNIVFNIKGQEKKYNRLEDCEDNLRGILNNSDTQHIVIQWSWQYETSRQNDIQDTADGENIIEYNFDINVLSYDV